MPVVPYGYSNWNFWLRHYHQQVNKPGVRNTTKFDVTLEEWKNLFEKKCFCGKLRKDFDPFQRRYCTPKHAALWTEKTLDWNSFRYRIVKRDDYTCQECKLKLRIKYSEFSYSESEYEIDHILAIVFGGMCFDEDNVRTLCGECHKKKTKSDMGIYAWWKRQANYDIGALIPDNQILMEEFVKWQ